MVSLKHSMGLMMTKEEYFIYAIKNNLLENLTWYYTFYAIPVKKEYSNEYTRYTDGKYEVKIEDEYVSIDGIYDNMTLFKYTDILQLPAKAIVNNDKDITTTTGIAICNYVLLANTFKDKIDYINKSFSIGSLVDTIATMLNNDEIEVSEYLNFITAASFLEKLARITTINTSEKTLMKPLGIDKFKTDLKKEMVKKYGDDWNKDITKIVVYDNALKKYYNDYLKDDPTNDKFVAGKIKNNALAKMYLTFGAETGLEKTGENVQQVDESLIDSTPKDKKKLAKMFNSSRAASFNRGAETMAGGLAAKQILRSTSSILITDKDCGVTYGKNYLVTKESLAIIIGRYMIVDKKPVLIKTTEDANKLLGKTIELRSPQYCHAKSGDICKICAGTNLADFKKGISLVMTNISNTILQTSLKSMHNSQVSVVDIDMQDVISN